MTQLLVGIAGWSYPDWEDVVYPARCAPSEKLRTVAEFLDCVELDSSFYRPPAARSTANWLRATANRPQFRFLAKAWRRFTHERETPWSRSEFELFTNGLAPLREAERLDALLFQFPWSFRHEPRNVEWLTRIADAFDEWPVAVEVRHDSWPEEFFRQYHWIYCNVDQPVLSHCLGPTEIATHTTGYFRLHGRNAQNWFREETTYGARYDYWYADNELDELLARMRRVAAKTQRTFAIFNNHKGGQAFANALQLKARLHPGVPVPAPATLLSRFPTLRSVASATGEEQLPLV